MLSDSYVLRTRSGSALYCMLPFLFLWVCERVCDDFEGMNGFLIDCQCHIYSALLVCVVP
jgi:hypothetical protein